MGQRRRDRERDKQIMTGKKIRERQREIEKDSNLQKHKENHRVRDTRARKIDKRERDR